MATLVSTNPYLGPLLGAKYLGGMGAAMLFGTTNLQVYFYFRNYKRDGIFLKCAVVYLWLLDSIHMAFIIVEMWHSLIDSFGNYTALDVLTRSYIVQLITSVIIILSVQSLYTLRVWKLSRGQKRLWPWILIVILAVEHAGAIILVIETTRTQLFSQVIQLRWSIYFSFIMATFTDIMLAVGICHLLYPGITKFAGTKSMVWTIIRYVIISGALTSVCTVVGVTTAFIMPYNFVFVGISFVLTKLYINSYLAMLNARTSIRGKSDDVVQVVDLEARISTMDFFGPSLSTSGDDSEEAGSRAPRARDKGGVKDIVRQRSHSVCW